MNMQLPVVSKAVVLNVVRKSLKGSYQARRDRVSSDFVRIIDENPFVGVVMSSMTCAPDYVSTPFLGCRAMGYGTHVYKILKTQLWLRGQVMPKVLLHVVGPLQNNFAQNSRGYLWSKFKQLLNGENPEIAQAASRWTGYLEKCGDHASAQKVVFVGTMVYHLIEHQRNHDRIAWERRLTA